MRVLVGDERLLAVLQLFRSRAADARAPLVAVRFLNFDDLVTHHTPAEAIAAQQPFQLPLLRALLFGLLLDDEDFQPREPVDFHFQDRVGLLVGQFEPLDQFLGCVLLAVALADDLEHLVERVVDPLESLQDVQPLLHFLQVELEPPRDDLEAEIEEVAEDLLQREALGSADLRVVGGHQRRQVDVEVRLQRGVLVEVRHHQVGVGVPLELQHYPDVLGGLVAHVHQRRQLPLAHQVAELRHQRSLVHRVGDAGDDDLLSAAG